MPSEVTIIDGPISLTVESNDSNCVSELFSCPLPSSELRLRKTGQFYYKVRADRSHHSYEVWSGDEKLASALSRADAMVRLLGHFHWLIATTAPRMIALDGAAVAWNGAALILLGNRFAGSKGPLGELIRMGASRVSHDCTVLSADGLVHCFPPSLSPRQHDGRPAPTTGTRRDCLFPAGLLVLADSAWEPISDIGRLAPELTLAALLQHTIAAGGNAVDRLRMLQPLADIVPAFVCKSGDARTVGMRMFQLFHQVAHSQKGRARSGRDSDV